MPRPIDTGSDRFPVSDRNFLRWLHERSRHDRSNIYHILDAAMIWHVTYITGGQPYSLQGVGDNEDDYALPIDAAKFPVHTVIDGVET
jgi:hypothetical protein